MLITLFAGGTAGLANNGDFIRVMKNTGISWQGAPGDAFRFRSDYTMGVSGGTFFSELRSVLEPVSDPDYRSVTFVFIYISKIVNLLYNHLLGRPSSAYSIVWLGIMCCLFQAAGAALFVRAFRAFHPAALCAAIIAAVFVFCDQGYVLYFNSFYGEQFQIFTLLIAVSSMLLVLSEKRILYGIVALISLFFYSCSKYANLPAGILLCCVCAALMLRTLPKQRIVRIISAGGSVLAIALILLQISSVPKWMDEVTTYHSVFYGIVREKQTAEADLTELGLDPKYAPLANTTGYMQEYPVDITTGEFRQDFYDRVSKTGIAFFYLKHPARLMRKLNAALLSSDSIAPPYLGNTREGASPRFTMIRRFDIWSLIRGRAGALNAPVFIALCLLILAYFIKAVFLRRGDIAAAILLTGLLAAALLQLILPVIGNGDADLAKHMQAFIQLYDMLICLGAVFTIQSLTEGALKTGGVKQAIISCGAAVCVIACVLLIALLPGRRVKTGASPEVGSVVTFGEYNGAQLEWYVLDNSGGSVWLWCTDEVAVMPFSGSGGGEGAQTGTYGSNDWEDSEIRYWLNTDFLSGFTSVQQASILGTQRQTYAADNNRVKAADGVHPYYWAHAAPLANAYNSDAYSFTLTEHVFIPGVDEICEYAAKLGIPYRTGRPYWTRTPYAPSGSMVRMVDRSGMVLHQDAAAVELGVRPSIVVSAGYFS